MNPADIRGLAPFIFTSRSPPRTTGSSRVYCAAVRQYHFESALKTFAHLAMPAVARPACTRRLYFALIAASSADVPASRGGSSCTSGDRLHRSAKSLQAQPDNRQPSSPILTILTITASKQSLHEATLQTAPSNSRGGDGTWGKLQAGRQEGNRQDLTPTPRSDSAFAGSERAGQRAAAIMSLLATAKANGVDPHAWLTDVLTRLPTTLDRDIETLLPHTWVPRG